MLRVLSVARKRRLAIIATALVLGVGTACGGAAPGPASVRLVDRFDQVTVENTPPAPTPSPILWDLSAGTGPGDAATLPLMGFDALNDIDGLALQDGMLVGRTHGEVALLHLAIPADVGLSDRLHAIEIRMRSSAGTSVGASWFTGEELDGEEIIEEAGKSTYSSVTTTLEPGDEVGDYELSTAQSAFVSLSLDGVRHLVIRPTDATDATFAIESVRVVSRVEHLASMPSGIGWLGLGEVYRDGFVSRSPERVRFDVEVPPQPWLELHVGTIEHAPLTFRVSIADAGTEKLLLERTISTPDRWESVPIDLSAYAGRTTTLSFEARSDSEGALAYWGTPVVRHRDDATAVAASSPALRELADDPAPPRGVIFVLIDTLRRDRLPWYGGARDNAPVLAGLAAEGTVFTQDVSQATWTKVSVPSILTSLYPSTHGITDMFDRLPASVTTLEELFLGAGYATFHTSSVPFTGKLTNLHQGVEVLHEATSVGELGHSSSKTARTYVDRLLGWLDAHQDAPFFVFLHAFDPHSPFEPYPPYDTLYTDDGEVAAHRERIETVKENIEDDHMREDVMPTTEELAAAGLDPDTFVDTELDWYDASIRAMDVEMGRIMERLKTLGLERDTLIVFMSDHGEEFLEHGRHFHGNNAYGEMLNVPLMMWWPGVVPQLRVDEVVESIDVYPTVLELSRIAVPEQAQGQSLMPLMASPAAPARLGWVRRPAFAERARMPSEAPLHKEEVDSYVIVADGWKLIHNTGRPEGWPEYELYDYVGDPLDADDVATDHPDVVEELAAELETWLQGALAARVEAGTGEGMSAAEMARLRSLGYIQ